MESCWRTSLTQKMTPSVSTLAAIHPISVLVATILVVPSTALASVSHAPQGTAPSRPVSPSIPDLLGHVLQEPTPGRCASPTDDITLVRAGHVKLGRNTDGTSRKEDVRF